MLRHYDRDLPLLLFIQQRRSAEPRWPMTRIVEEAADQFGKEPKTIERTIKRWGQLPQMRAASAHVAQFGADLSGAFAFIEQYMTEREIEELREADLPTVLDIARMRARAKAQPRRSWKKKSTTK